MHCPSYSLAEATVFNPNILVSCGINCTISKPAIGHMSVLPKFREVEDSDCDPCFTLLFHSTDQRTPMNHPLTIMLCLTILPVVILYSAAAAASGVDNGSKPRDKSLSSVIKYNSSFLSSLFCY